MTMRILTLTVKTNITMLVRSKRAAFMMAIKKSMNGMLGKAYPTHHGLLAGTVPKPSVNLYLYPDTPRESHARQKRPRQGVFFRSGSDPEVRATVYGTIPPHLPLRAGARHPHRTALRPRGEQNQRQRPLLHLHGRHHAHHLSRSSVVEPESRNSSWQEYLGYGELWNLA